MGEVWKLIGGPTLFSGNVSTYCRLHPPKVGRSIWKNKAGTRERRSFQASRQGSRAVRCCLGSSSKDEVGSLKEEGPEGLPCVQTLSKFPREELRGKVVMVRVEASLLLREDVNQSSVAAVRSIRYLCDSKAKVILVGEWGRRGDCEIQSEDSVADWLSSIVQHKVVVLRQLENSVLLELEMLGGADVFLVDNLTTFKEEVANSPDFAKLLASGVDVFVNDSFSGSHKILSSTVGLARFCHACMAGFHLEESLELLQNVMKSGKKPYIAIIGGANLRDKEAAVCCLASICDALVFVGMMSFQIMHAMGLQVASTLLEPGACKAASNIVQLAQDRNIPVIYPIDFWCVDNQNLRKVEEVAARDIGVNMLPVDLGPASLDRITSILMNSQKITWIGPVKFKFSDQDLDGSLRLAKMLHDQTKRNCDVSVVGEMACDAMKKSKCSSGYNRLENASAVWEALKGRKLPGIIALDRAYPVEIDWTAVYGDPTKPLAVDIGSGNGLFLLQMAMQTHDVNFLGLEINKKLVTRCLDSVHQSGIENGYFIATNATSTFRSIISSYPGELVLVSIQCPNPDFNDPENRWRMLRRSLVEAIADLLSCDGKVFLQSDVEAVAIRMRELFIKYGKGKIMLKHQCASKLFRGLWLEENPFGVRSDWERHVLDRGGTMYRLMLSKPAVVG